MADDAITADSVADDAIGVAQLSATGTASSTTFLRGDNSWAAAHQGSVDINSGAIDGTVIGANSAVAANFTTIGASGTTTTVALTASGIITANADMLIGGTTPTLTIGDAGAEDAKIVFDGNAQDFHIGLDDTADSLVLGLGSALGTTSHIVMDATGAVTKPLTPAFFAYNSVADANATGNGVLYTVLFDTELFDQNADYNAVTGQFVAPVSGRYFLQAQAATDAQTTTNTDATFQLNTSNKDTDTYYNPGNMEGPSVTGQCSISASGIFDMDANDTAHVKIRIQQGTQIIGITANNTWFSGVLVA